MKDKVQMTGIILAGGKAERCDNRDKGVLKVGGRNIIQAAIDSLSALFPILFIVTNKPDIYRFAGVGIVEDDVEYRGSLNGILCGLRASTTRYNFVTACDMPFVSEEAVRLLLDRERNYDILTPANERGLHPLFSIYSKRCVPIMEERVNKGLMKIQDIFPLLNTKTVPMDNMGNIANRPDPFFNVNTPNDLKMAQEIIK